MVNAGTARRFNAKTSYIDSLSTDTVDNRALFGQEASEPARGRAGLTGAAPVVDLMTDHRPVSWSSGGS